MAIKDYNIWICNLCKREFEAPPTVIFSSESHSEAVRKWEEAGKNFECVECTKFHVYLPGVQH